MMPQYIPITKGKYQALLEFETMYDCRIPLIGDCFLPSDDCYYDENEGQWYITSQAHEFVKQRGFVW